MRIGVLALCAAAILLPACSQVQTSAPESGGETAEARDAGSADAAEKDASDGDAAAAGDAEAGPDEAEPGGMAESEIFPEAPSEAEGRMSKPDRPIGAPAGQPAEEPETIKLKEPEGTGPSRQTVGLLLPLSGPRSALGQNMLRAAELALFDIADGRFDLIVRDTKGTPRGAETAARSAVDAGANLLLGPVYSSSVKAVKPVATAGQVPVLAFSNNPRVAEPGTYVMGRMPGQQVRRIVSYTISQGRRNFAAVVPDNIYGDLVVEALRESLTRYGGRLHHVARYEAGSEDVSGPVERLSKTGFSERPDTAVLLPAGGTQLETVASTLRYYDIERDVVKYLGTAAWDDPSLRKASALQGGWFPAPPPQQDNAFRRRYRGTFAAEPAELASLAYDATALAALLARRNAADGNPAPSAYTEQSLIQANGFAGVDGVFRLRSSGTVQRLYAVKAIRNGAFEVIDNAPSSFEPRIN